MILVFRDEDGQTVIEADQEGIDWLRRGLDQLEERELGGELSSPALSSDGVGEVILRRR